MRSFRPIHVLRRHRVAATVLITGLLAGLMFAAMTTAQQAPPEDPPLPPSMAEPPGKPQRDGSPTPDPVRVPVSRICASVPDLCGLARSLGAAHSRGDLTAFTALLAPTEVACIDAKSGVRLPGLLCSGLGAPAQASGYTVVGLGKQASLVSESEMVALLSSWLQLPPGKAAPSVVAPVSVGCAIGSGQDVDCSVTAIVLGLVDARTKAIGGTVVLFFRQASGGRPFGLVGASGGLPDGAALTGGTERRIMAGWTGNATGAWYFELLGAP